LELYINLSLPVLYGSVCGSLIDLGLSLPIGL